MRLAYHPLVHSEVSKILSYYEGTASAELAYEFQLDFTAALEQIAQRPQTFAVRYRNIRRINLERIPYHVLFWIGHDSVRVLTVRHHHRHPAPGMRRR